MTSNCTLRKIIAGIVTVLMLLCIYKPEAASAETYDARIIVSQTFTESAAPEGMEFKYILSPVDGAPVTGFSTSGAGLTAAALNSGGAYEFSIDGTNDIELKYTGLSKGTHHYTLECAADDRAGRDYIFDDVKYDIYLYADNGSGQATVVIKDLNGNKPDEAHFTHSYGDADPIIMIDPPVRKSVEGNPKEDATFKFRLRAVENTAGIAVKEMPMPDGSSNGEKFLTVIGAGEEEFGWWTYVKPGVYTYDISEVDMGDEHYRYDTTMYTLVDTVTRQDNKLTVQRTITDSNGKVVQNTLVRSSREASDVTLDYVNKYLPGGGDDGNTGDDDGNTGDDDGDNGKDGGDDNNKDGGGDDNNKDGGGDRDKDGGGSNDKDGRSGLSRLIPKTGDTAAVMLWAVILGAVILALGVLRSRRRSREKTTE